MARLRYRPTRLILSALLRTLSADLWSLLAWLALCGLLAVGVWAWTLTVIAHDKERIRDTLRASAAADARAYAEQLEHAISQIDYVLLSQKFHWTKWGAAIDL